MNRESEVVAEGLEIGPALDGVSLALLRLDVELWRLEVLLRTAARQNDREAVQPANDLIEAAR